MIYYISLLFIKWKKKIMSNIQFSIFYWSDQEQQKKLSDLFYLESDLYHNMKLSNTSNFDRRSFIIMDKDWDFKMLQYTLIDYWKKIRKFIFQLNHIPKTKFFIDLDNLLTCNSSLFDLYFCVNFDNRIRNLDVHILIEKEDISKQELNKLKEELEKISKNVTINTCLQIEQENKFEKIHEFQKLLFCWKNTYFLDSTFENIESNDVFNNQVTFWENMYWRWFIENYEHKDEDNLHQFLNIFELNNEQEIYRIFQDFFVKYYNNFSYKNFDFSLNYYSPSDWTQTSYIESIFNLYKKFYKEHILEKNTTNFYKEFFNYLIKQDNLWTFDVYSIDNQENIKILFDYFKSRIWEFSKRIEKI